MHPGPGAGLDRDQARSSHLPPHSDVRFFPLPKHQPARLLIFSAGPQNRGVPSVASEQPLPPFLVRFGLFEACTCCGRRFAFLAGSLSLVGSIPGPLPPRFTHLRRSCLFPLSRRAEVTAIPRPELRLLCHPATVLRTSSPSRPTSFFFFSPPLKAITV